MRQGRQADRPGLVVSSLGGFAIISLCQLLCEKYCHSCYLLDNLFLFLDASVVCSFNQSYWLTSKAIKEEVNRFLFAFSRMSFIT